MGSKVDEEPYFKRFDVDYDDPTRIISDKVTKCGKTL